MFYNIRMAVLLAECPFYDAGMDVLHAVCPFFLAGSQGQVPDPVENRFFCHSFVKWVRDLSLDTYTYDLSLFPNASTLSEESLRTDTLIPSGVSKIDV